MDLGHLSARLAEFARERDWERFHSPKNLTSALAVEVAELLELFQWLNEKQSSDPAPALRQRAAEELADVFIYTVRLADRLGVDLESAVEEKLTLNAAKYPAQKCRGNSKKYTEL